MKINPLKNFYYPLFIFALLLAIIGLFNLYSATLTFEKEAASTYFTAQLLYTVLGIVAMFVVSLLSVKSLYSLAPFIYLFALGLLVLVLIVGAERHGSLSWLDLGFVRLQPSEFGKLGLIFILSRHFAAIKRDVALGFRDLVIPTFYFLIPTLLVVSQNDLGSSLFYGFIFGSMILIQGIRLRIIIFALVLIGVVGVGTYQYGLKPYQKNRIVSFMNPELDPKGAGYHLVQSKIAVGSGGITGKGYKKGQSHKLKFLPERHTDFIFPVLLEEWGFVGGTLTLMLYFLFLLSGVNVATRSENRFGFFMSLGLVAFFFWHLVINLGGVLGLIPLTGVTLPFFSYGGSSLVANWMAIGFLLSVVRSRVY